MDPLLKKYFKLATEKLTNFKEYEIAHVPYKENTHADVLSRLASTRSPAINYSFVQKTKKMQSIRPVGKAIMNIYEPTSLSWITLIKKYIEHENLPPDPSKATLVKKGASEYTIVQGTMYKRGLFTPLLRCLNKIVANYAFLKVHEGIVWKHLRAATLAKKKS